MEAESEISIATLDEGKIDCRPKSRAIPLMSNRLEIASAFSFHCLGTFHRQFRCDNCNLTKEGILWLKL